MKQFENLTATELYCPRCRVARPVRERLLLVLPHSELHEYRCTFCAESLGTREVRHPAQPVRMRMAPSPAARPRRPGGPAAGPGRP